jgi:peptidoglycan biosynthesis protein MviN/MurJ (putative lipid II flippase)
MTTLFYILVVWTILYVLANIYILGWAKTEETNKNIRKIASLINLVYLSLLLVYLFNFSPK